MDKIVDFIVSHWSYISFAILFVIEIIIFVIKKKPVQVYDTMKQVIVCMLPGLIKLVESEFPSGGHGSEKKELVLKHVEDLFKENDFTFTSSYRSFTEKMIEDILSTPSKK